MKIVKKTVVIDFAKLVGDRDAAGIEIGDDLVETLAQVAAELTGGSLVVEAAILPDSE